MARLVLATALILAALAPAAGAVPQQDPVPGGWDPIPAPEIAYRQSIPVGLWWAGKLRRGVQMPAEGPDWFTWDPVLKRSPDRGWRRWGTDRLVRTLVDVIEQYRLENALAPRVGIGDLSRRHGGDFGVRFGGLGHDSHQNGLDADVMYPRRDRAPLAAVRPAQVDRALAQDLVDRFRAAGAVKLFVGPHLHLHGPRGIVVALVHHDDHVHVRIANPRRSAPNVP